MCWVDQVQELAVDTVVTAHLGVEGGRHQRPLPDSDDSTGGRPVADAGEHLDVRSGVLDPGGADEDRVDRLVESGEVEITLEGVHLPPEGVAPDGDVETAEGLLVGDAVLDPVGEHDHPGAGPEDRQGPLYPPPGPLPPGARGARAGQP